MSLYSFLRYVVYNKIRPFGSHVTQIPLGHPKSTNIVEGDCRKGESERKNENIILARGQGIDFSLGLRSVRSPQYLLSRIYILNRNSF